MANDTVDLVLGRIKNFRDFALRAKESRSSIQVYIQGQGMVWAGSGLVADVTETGFLLRGLWAPAAQGVAPSTAEVPIPFVDVCSMFEPSRIVGANSTS